jgi:hypothetical protein
LLKVETAEVDENKKGPYTFQIEVEKARIDMTDEKSKGE